MTAGTPDRDPCTLACLVAGYLGRYRFAFTEGEKELQAGIAAALEACGLPFDPEFRLGPRDVVDFFVDERLGVECKVDGSLKDVLLQLMRYAQHDRIAGLILVSSRLKHRHLPPILNGKPLVFVPVLRGIR